MTRPRFLLARLAALVALAGALVAGGSSPAGASAVHPAAAGVVTQGGDQCSHYVRGPDGILRCADSTGGGTATPGTGSPGGGGGAAAQWNALCAGAPVWAGAYQPGYHVEILVGSEVSPADFQTLGTLGFMFVPRSFDPAKTYVNEEVLCYRGAIAIRYIRVVELGAAGGPAIDVFALRDQAQAQVTVPDPKPASNPPFDQPGRFGVVRIPTWYWIEPGGWAPLTGSASLGGITVTVTATPKQVAWTPGDGSADVVCPDPGVPWQPSLAESATTCSHTYTSSSANQAGAAFHVQVTTTWEFTWAIGGVNQGAFGNAAPTAAFDYQVGEIQAIQSN